MQDEDAVKRLGKYRVDPIRLTRHRKTHLQKVRSVIEVIARIDEWLPDIQLVRGRRNGRQLGDQADRGNLTLPRIPSPQVPLPLRQNCRWTRVATI